MFTSLRGYSRDRLRGDLPAGLTVWAILVPEALAYATIAGVSPVVGLYAAPPALLLYAAFGSSRHLVVGPMAATAALSAATIAAVGATGDPAALTVGVALIVGVLALLAGVLRLGFLANFISEPVLKGFIIGLALTVIVGQIPKLFGIESGSGDFFEQLRHLVTQLGETSGITLAVGLASLALILGLRRISPRIPGSLVVAALGIIAVPLLGLEARGVDVVGPIDAGLPSFGLPDLELDAYVALALGSAGVMLVGFTEGLGSARTYASRFHYEIDPNRELIGFGAANLASGFASGMVVNGSLSKTAVNAGAGAKSQVSGIIAAVLTVVTLLFLTGLFETLPEATLAAIVIAALIELVDIRAMVELYRPPSNRLARIYGPVMSRPDFIAALGALVGVLVFDTLPGLFLGVVLSILLLIYRASRPYIARLGRVDGTSVYSDAASHPEVKTRSDIAILRVEGGLFFANAEHVQKHIMEVVHDGAGRDGVRAIVLDLESVPFVDTTASRMVAELAEDLRNRDVALVVARETGQVRDFIKGEVAEPAAIAHYRSVAEAVEALDGAS